MKAKIHVTLKDGVLDPQGKAVSHALKSLGFDEFKAYLENTKVMAISGELIHGLKYPTPFFSIENDPNGARGTRALMLQLIAGLFIFNYLI